MGAAAVPYIAMGAAAALQYENTERTAHRQDAAAASAIRNQSRIQKEGDAKVNETVQKLAGSNAAAAREQRLDDYLQVLRRNKGTITAGLSPTIGSDTFKTDAATAANDAQGFAQKTASLMARMDAPQIQRQNEAFDYGRLATDLGLVGRESRGQAFLDQLRQSRIRRNAKMDLAANLLNAYGSAASGGGDGTVDNYTSMGGGWGYSGGRNLVRAPDGSVRNLPTY